MIWDVIVIGGGAAGLMAAGKAASLGAQVLLLERMEQLGKKIRISGKGRCNLTNASDFPHFLANFPGNGRFLTGAYHRFDAEQVRSFFTDLGVMTKVERGNRVFPVSDDADQVADALVRWIKGNRVQIEQRVRVDDIQVTTDGILRASCGNRFWLGRTLILASGGASYPGTGSTGDGWKLAEKLGHSTVPAVPSLVPLRTREAWPATVSGLGLRNVKVYLQCRTDKQTAVAGKEEQFGELLFTHFGVSGPTVLTLSRTAAAWIREGCTVQLVIDLKPGLLPEQLEQRIQRDFDEYSRKQIKNGMHDLLPKALIPIVLQEAGIDGDKSIHQVTKQERQSLVNSLKGLTLHITECLPLAAAIVTQGGVVVKEVSPKTMESKIIPGMYFAGELLDIDGYTGGFNLQAAFATGWIAGEAAVQSVWTSARPG